MSKTNQLRQKYVADAEMMASKSRFGYFSLLPSHTAAISDNSAPHPHKDSDGKVPTDPRNIYSGITASGMVKKSYFSYTPSAFHGSPFEDPGKPERKQNLEEAEKWKGKETYKPACLNQTLAKTSYEYISPNDPTKKRENHRGPDGRVITQSPNILTNPQSKLSYDRNKQFKYIESLTNKHAQEKQIKKTQPQQKKEAFRIGSPHKDLFTSDSESFFDANIKKKEGKKMLTKSMSHEGPFKPSCISRSKDFTPIVYKEEGQGKQEPKVIKKQNKHSDPFKLVKVEHNSKPTPSINLSKVNLLRGYR